jgi:hypothetical protein
MARLHESENLDRPEVSLPYVFQVGATVGLVQGGGTVTISREAVAFKQGELVARLNGPTVVRHTDRHITFVKARLGLPWLNTALIITDGKTTVSAGFWGVGRSRVRGALRRAGFEVRERATWFSLGAEPRSARDRPHAELSRESGRRALRRALSALAIGVAAASGVALVAVGGPAWVVGCAACAIALLIPLLRP